ncbi:hypothetical protein SERLADRAFT_445648 [Serpula lacrymans var. lacrymans S7.9]|uniref:Uncharacterized protein n=1 Tax=Serpula lacrymans var. lacrymans (strain S7.9) TaxID=578457 RepID=F8NH22_SERL9|nr:uncharacterized protein SERLADRAFT_445648 [Serpula lacrymans var. lacrymans S7.9]EGO29879.1 hypothetical protein SERLADRAFT_445648 [Serpula lacrymans var. lacrymans S7.9]
MLSLPVLGEVQFDVHGISAWRLLLRAEAEALKDHPSFGPPKYTDKLVGVRVLGFSLRDFWDHNSEHLFVSTIAYEHLLLDIRSCFSVDGVAVGSKEEEEAQHAKVYKLGLHYRNNLMRVFRFNTGPTPPSSAHASPPSFEKHKEVILSAMVNAPGTKGEAKKRALLRDGYKCMISGAYDYDSCLKYPEIEELAANNVATNTQCAHLFSETAQDINQVGALVLMLISAYLSPMHECPVTAFTILKMFGLETPVRKILGGQVNNLCNVLTMASSLHSAFDHFEFWLEEVPGESNTYNVQASNDIFFRYAERPPRRVKFQLDPEMVADFRKRGLPPPELPDRNLIAIRAACARVAYKSGAAEQINQVARDRDDIMVIAEDGSNADFLSSVLSHISTNV